MKVAQYPAAAGLGIDAKELSDPPGTIETFGSRSLTCGCTSVSVRRSSRFSFGLVFSARCSCAILRETI